MREHGIFEDLVHYRGKNSDIIVVMRSSIAGALFIVVVATALLYGASPALAQEFDLTVIPAKVELEVQAGQSLEFSVELRNNGQQALDLLVYPMDYAVNPDNTFIFEPPGYYTYSCADWIEIKRDRVGVPTGSSLVETFQVSVPEGAEPGGHYGVIFFQDASEPNPDIPAELTPRVGSLILITVPGEIIREGSVKKFDVESDYFSLWGPSGEGGAGWPARNIAYHLEVENTGNVHITVKALISYHSTFGSGSGSIELGTMTILPETVRYFDGTLPNPPFIGRFEAEAVIMYGPDQFTFDIEERATTSFTVFPVLWFLLLILGIFVIWLGVHILRKRLKGKGLRISIKVEKKSGEDESGEDE
jgi:hypothetical protein